MNIDTHLATDIRNRMVALMDQLAQQAGYTQTSLPDVRFLRVNQSLSRMPVLYEPGIVIVCQGSKRGFLGDRVYRYDEQHCLAVSVPVPFTMETLASPEKPLLAVYMRLNLQMAADLVLQIGQQVDSEVVKPQGMVSTRMDEAMSLSVIRFLEAMGKPLEAAVLGPALVREIYFRVLSSEQGGAIRAALTAQGQFGKIAKAIRKIHTSFQQSLDIDALAHEAGMGIATFHAHFKSVTKTSPMQYLKSTRLHQARLLMAKDHMSAAAASAQVGYESASQFGREFKRLFGSTPAQEVKRMQANFTSAPAKRDGMFVASH